MFKLKYVSAQIIYFDNRRPQYVLFQQYQHKMFNQALENNQSAKPNTQKYSLRQKMVQYKNKNQLSLLPNLSNQDLLGKDKNKISHQGYLRPNEYYQHCERAQVQNQKLGCFEAVKKTLQINKFKPVTYVGHHPTVSATSASQYQLNIHTKNQKQSIRGDIQTKNSLKNTKKNQRYQSVARLSNPVLRQSDQSFQTDNFSQRMSTQQQRSHDLKSHQGKRSKYSLKSKKLAKIDVLLNLKYSDLARPVGKQNQNQLKLKNSNAFSNLRPKLLCGSSKSPNGGCKCDPRCYWTDQWLKMVKQAKWTDEFRARDEKQFEMAIKQIQRDLLRTQPGHPNFNNPQMLNMLNQVLSGYAIVDHEVSYVQGMNFVASAIVYHACDTYSSLKIMNHLMKNAGMRRLFMDDLSFGRKVAQKLNQDLRRLSYDLHSHLLKSGIDLQMFASSWYFSLCGSFVPLDFMHHFIDKFMKKGFTGVNQLLITLLLKLGDKIMTLFDTQLMQVFSNQKLNWEEIRLRSDRLLLPLIQI